MPSLEAQDHAVPGVAAFSALLSALLARAEEVKPTASIEPALNKADFGDLSSRLSSLFAEYPPLNDADTGDSSENSSKGRQFAIIETAVRDLFSRLVAATPIESPNFVKVWNLFDLLSILSDDGECESALPLWLIEELLDSQTIAVCRKIFDFLESRRERIIVKNFKQSSQLIVLRTCNELLRRLSRAEDTAFCGRVFIFMFQSFPLGDKSSVNLRGEYHVENITTFDDVETEKKGEVAADKMDIDTSAGAKSGVDQRQSAKGPSSDGKKAEQSEQPLEPDVLYPMFWSLQECFSQPKKLLDKDQFVQFKRGLEATMTTLRAIQNEQGARPSKAMEDTKKVLKRKLSDAEGDDITNTFNPKYLTSRDLFELEISDISFRRYVLIQALVIMDFLLSLSPKAKQKLATIKVPNKSVNYVDQVLSEEDTKWAADMREKITTQLKLGFEGPHFHRMVETVLARDRNWIRWKVESCPPIGKSPVTPEEFAEAQKTILKATTPKGPPAFPVGTLPLGFLDASDEKSLFDELKSRERYQLPDLDTYKGMIADDDFDIDMAQDSKAKSAAIEKKASTSWRALRIASRTKLSLFDRIDDPEKIDTIFEEKVDPDEIDDLAEPVTENEDAPEDKRLVIISGPRGTGTTALVSLLLERCPGVFRKVVRHTSRKPGEGEVDGKDYHFVNSQAFNMMLDGDQFLEFKNFKDYDEGTNRKSVDAISESGRIPLIDLDLEAVRLVRDMGFSARFLLLKPSSVESLIERLNAADEKEELTAEIIKAAEAEMNDPEWEQNFDAVIIDDDLETAFEDAQRHIFEKNSEDDEINGKGGAGEGDQAMVDAPAS